MGKKKNKEEKPEGIILPDDFVADKDQAQEETKSGLVDNICKVIEQDNEELLEAIYDDLESLKKAVKERDEFLQHLQRTQADFANYQKRMKRDKECWQKYQDEPLLRDLLPALDNLPALQSTWL